jgi:hypothetical protein
MTAVRHTSLVVEAEPPTDNRLFGGGQTRDVRILIEGENR